MKILIVTGSPHRAGTSDTLAACFAKGSGTVAMMPEKYRRQAHELGAKIGR